MQFKGLTASDIDACIISTVVPDVLFNLTSCAKQYFNVTPQVIGDSDLTLGMKVLIDRPDEIGADRLVDAVAAAALYKPPLIIVDFGTATTFDVVDREGNYAGGVIAPGINLSLDALSNAAAKLPRVAIKRTERVIGKSTISAMQSGIFWGYIGLIEGLILRITAEFGGKMRVIATGGLAPLLAEATKSIDAIEPELTLSGLRLIYERNRA
jgi:type III pantothenate kinase